MLPKSMPVSGLQDRCREYFGIPRKTLRAFLNKKKKDFEKGVLAEKAGQNSLKLQKMAFLVFSKTKKHNQKINIYIYIYHKGRVR